MRKFVEGDVVTDGERVGQIVSSFYWRDSDDGTMVEPSHDTLPVMWNDGTQGFRKVAQLEYA
jgi:hypothetical protein